MPDSAQMSFLSGPNAAWLAGLYAQYARDPASVDASWRSFFAGLNEQETSFIREANGPSWWVRFRGDAVPSRSATAVEPARVVAVADDAAAVRSATLDSIRALMLIRAYRVRGHMMADLDPLGLNPRPLHPELNPATYGFTEADWDRPIFIDFLLGVETATLRRIVEILQQTYCGPVGVEYMHIQDAAQKAWIQERIEAIHNRTDFTDKGRRTILERLTAAEGIEQFLHNKFPGTKRFGLDGGESLIPALEQVLKRGGQLGVKEVVLGMSHLGRLNVLTNVMLKRFAALFAEF